MSISIRRLTTDDLPVLELLAAEDGNFDIDGRGEAIEAPDPDRARGYLANPAVLFWIATDHDVITGFLQCLVLPIRTGRGREVLVYEIGVRKAYRRVGVGRALMIHMESWMRENDIGEMWVAADNPGAERFYAACGYARTGPQFFQPVYMSRELD
ncbi:MAG: GNAT family N-acetyltransferase [Gemmatimonadaceae bacterium]